MKNLFIILAILVALPCLAQQRRSIDILEDFSAKTAEAILLNFYEQDTIYLEFINPTTDYLLEKSLLKNKNYTFILYNKANSPQNIKNLLKINPSETAVKYSAIDRNRVRRDVSCESSAVKVISGKISAISIPAQSISDELTYSEALNDNSSLPNFLQATVPQKPSSFYEKIVEPAIIVSSAILTVALFFSIRSK